MGLTEKGRQPVTAERYDQLLALRMESPGKVTGVFDLDFDRQEVSSADATEGWNTWSMQDVSPCGCLRRHSSS